MNKNAISIRDKCSKGDLAKEILKSFALGGLVVSSFALPNLPQIFYLLGVENCRDRYRLKRSIIQLQNRKLVKIYEKDGEDVVEITKNGKQKLLKYKFEEMKILRPKKWDGRWRIIIFDIPEKFKKARNALTRKIKDMEIYPLQKSVFVCPFNCKCKDEIDFIGEFFNIRRFICYIEADVIENDERLKRFYNL